jgi:peptidoglycan hydrolase-like protein with peptidoglycan-binding domain
MERTIILLQDILSRLGYLSPPYEQNTLDEITRAAVRRFQQLHGLDPSGEADNRVWELLLDANERGECVVMGQVIDQAGPMARAVVIVRDRDLGDPANWPQLGAAQTGPDGRFVITYFMEQAAPGDRRINGREVIADLVFELRETPGRVDGFDLYRLPGQEKASEDEIALGIQARRIEEIRIVARTTERRREQGATEYERLLAAFRAVWPQLSPAVLDEGRREPEFVARELDAPQGQIDALVSAFRLSELVFDRSVPEPVLYGLARGDHHLLGLERLVLAGSGQLKDGVLQAVERSIIPPQTDETIERSIRQIRELAPRRLLAGGGAQGGSGYGEVLRHALPNETQQLALLRAAPGRESNPSALWDNLRANPAFAEPGAIERAQFALQLDALTNRHLPLMTALQREQGVASTRALLDFPKEKLKEIVGRADVGTPEGTPGESPEERVEAYVNGLVSQLQFAFPTETIAKSIAAAPPAQVGGEAAQSAIASVLARATSEEIRAEGKAFDIRSTHIDGYLAEHADFLLAEVDVETRPKVIETLKRSQRLYRVSTGAASFDWLLENHYNSAFDIAETPMQTFAAHARQGLDETQAMMMYSRSVALSNASLAAHAHLYDAKYGVYPAALALGADRVEAGAAIDQTIAKYLPSWSELFEKVSWCDCPDCRSVYSPAAYLVDLLNFLDKSTKNAQGQNPLDVLLTLRPDLAQLKLTCENTNTVIPYVDLVNEVLESLAVSLDPLKIPSFDVAGATTKELQAAPQHINWEAYLTPGLSEAQPRLDRAVYPPGLPFDAPLRAARIYLEHLEAAREDLMAAFSVSSDEKAANALAAERLGLSPNEFAVITDVGLDSAPSDLQASIEDRYGWSLTPLPNLTAGATGPFIWALKRKLNIVGAGLTIGLNPAAELFDAATQTAVQNFQADNGLPVTGEVDAAAWKALIAIMPGLPSAFLPQTTIYLERSGLTLNELLDLLKMRFVNPEQRTFEIIRRLRLPGDDLLAFVQAEFENPSAALEAALIEADVKVDDFIAWARERLADDAWKRLQQTILVDGPVDRPCDLGASTIRHWDSAAPMLADEEWLKLDRLARLWRAIGWTLDDLDLTLTALGATDVGAEVVRQLAQIHELGRRLDLPVAQIVSLWEDLDPSRPGSLYEKRFRNRAPLRLDTAFEPDWKGNALIGAVIGDHLPALRAGLRCSGADLDALRAQLGLANDGAALDIAVLSDLLRRVILARALQMNVRDLIRMIDLTGLQPFQSPGDERPTLTFVNEVQRLQQSGLNAAQLAYVLAEASATPPNEARDRMLLELRNGLRAIAADLDPANETDGSLTRRALALLQLDGRLIDAAMQTILGVDQPIVVLPQAPVPPPAIPQEWAERLRYNPQEKSLACRGALTDAERLTVREFSADPGYRDAVDALHAAPRTTLQQAAAALANEQAPFPAAATLLADTLFIDDLIERETRIRARLKLILDDILPPLRDRLSRMLIKQTIAGLQLEPSMVALLLEGERNPGQPILPAIDPTMPLIDDLLKLAVSDEMKAAAQACELLSRLSLLIETLGFKTDDVSVIARRLVAFRPEQNHLCAYSDWSAIAAYARIRSRPGQPEGLLARLWEATTVEAAQSVLAETLDWPAEIIAGLMSVDGLDLDIAKLQNPATLERLIVAGELTLKLGAPVAQTAGWGRNPIDRAAAEAARDAVEARYEEDAWLEIAKSLSNPLREAQRKALVSYLTPRMGVKDANGLYQKLLIDVEMSPCMRTSRIKQAISSVQLFIQRCQLNLVKPVAPQAIDSRQWKWMQNYRVWEANRKVLLYPENWILPELRDDKTPFFKELESALLQDDVTDLNVERALLSYLEKLDQTARLDIVAMRVQDEFEPQEKFRTVVHLFGRTPNPAHAYFYRRYVVTRNGAASWTPWEAVPVDLQGSLIAPVIFHRRLYLFWALITTKTKQPPANSKSPQAQQQFQEIQIAWSEYRDGSWSPKSVTDVREALTEDFTPGDEPGLTAQGVTRGPDVIERLEARVEGDRLRLLCIASRDVQWVDNEKKLSYTNKFVIDGSGNLVEVDGNVGYTYAPGTFVLDQCRGRMIKDPTMDQTWASRGFILRRKDGRLEAKPLADKPLQALTVFDSTEETTQLAEGEWVHEQESYLVFSDANRAYFAQITPTWSPLDPMIENPRFSYPIITTQATQRLQAEISVKSESAIIKASQAKAEASSNAWASASASMAALAVNARRETSIVNDKSALMNSAVIAASAAQKNGYYTAASPRRDVRVRFETLFHPFVCAYIKTLQQYGPPGLFAPSNQRLALTPNFAGRYRPNNVIVSGPPPTEVVDFGETEKPGVYRTSAYSVYNWELFFHLPMLVADRLSQNQRFEDAQRWLHYVFNPTDGAGGYWKFLPFQKTPQQSLEEWLKQLNAGDPELQKQIAEWKDHPFEPHRIARMRLSSYKKFVVMRYLDNLIAWGDQLFERDTIETINQATQLYVMAADLLGERPVRIPLRGEPSPMTFAQMRGKLDALSNTVAEFENAFPTLSSATMAGAPDTVGLLGVSRSLYFCIPPNDKLLGYWETVADRLFKIRNCMNIAGVVRQLPLFEPPIDPALLVRAAAQGLDLNSVLSDLSAPLPQYRFEYILHKAVDACMDLKSLGGTLLSVLEKKDAETLAAIRANHETALLKGMLEIRIQQEQEAAEQIEALNRSREVPLERLRFHRWLMGIEGADPEPGAAVSRLPFGSKPSSEGGVFLIEEEKQELSASHSARDWQVIATSTEALANISHLIPNFAIVTAPWGAGIKTEYGGQHIGAAINAIARHQSGLGIEDTYDASHAAKMAGYKRRNQDYAVQANLAGLEIMQIDKQITAATIRKEVARLERENLEKQIARAEMIEDRLKSKYTNADLFGWMQGQIASVYFQSYQLAYDLAKQAERCYRYELGLTSSNYVQFGAWDSLRKGLLAGEKLHLQLKRLERAHQDQRRRELELTKHVSLLQHAPLALIQLKETGRCEIDLPEWMFDMDYPGHYMRRVKSVSMSIPAVVGPYTSVNATLTLLANETRITGGLSKNGGKYERDLENEDDRFVNDFAAIQSIAASSGQNDSGMFEVNFRDERYLPFEGAGATSRWRIVLDPDCNRFDLGSVTDVVLHLKYTARDGGERLRQKAKDYWKKLAADLENAPLTRLFSLKHEFPSEWHRLRTKAETNGDHAQTIAITRDRFPFLFLRNEITITTLDLFGVPKTAASATKLPAIKTPKPDEAPVELVGGAPLKPLLHQTGNVQVVVKENEADAGWNFRVPAADVALSLDQLDDLLMVCRYRVKAIAG